MVKKVLVVFVVLVLLAGAFLGIWYLYQQVVEGFNQAKEDVENISLPGPLKAEEESDSAYLTRAGIIDYTNRERVERELEPLAMNGKLNKSAKAKAQDMLDRQYFAHDAPTGEGVDTLVQEQDYSYLLIGENLALGNFEDDQAVVQAWMDSPGHRANILKAKYSEIGVGIVQGIYNGRTTWLAVQHFGRPSSDCTAPSASLKRQIDTNNQELEEMQVELNDLKKIIASSSGEERALAQTEYNSLVVEYNALAKENKKLSSQYNQQVDQYNSCLY